MRSRRWNIRSRITALLLLPLLSLAALWTYAADLSLGNALTLRHVNTIGNHLARPLGEVFIGVQLERRTSLEYLASPNKKGRTARPGPDLDGSRSTTDAAVRAFRNEAANGDVRAAENTQVRHAVDTAERQLEQLVQLRRQVDARKSGPDAVLDAYTQLNTSIAEAFDAMTNLPDSDAQRFGQALYIHTVASDLLSQADALISASAGAGRMDPETYAAVVQDTGAADQFDRLAMSHFPARQLAPYQRLAAPGQPQAKVATMIGKLATAGPHASRLPFSASQWHKAYDAQWTESNQIALDDISVIFTLTGPPADRALWKLLTAGVAGLVALVASVVLSVRLGRSLVGDVARLRDSARNLTDDQLRDVVGRLRRGDHVDVAADMTRPAFVHHEMALLGDAFFTLQVTAVELAEEDVRLHESISDVFVNLARRSQTLVQRQLELLESMERHEEDANRLGKLFQLDQMATRLRRYAEGLIIVSGGTPGRVWRHAVPVVDVVRGAIAETDDYKRVVVMPVPHIGMTGHAVADVVHLLAELIENAQNFSPDNTQVRVGVSMGANGLVVEIDDRGLGMDDEQLLMINQLFTERTELSVLDSTRLGLVTVGRLAQRHRISVALRNSPYGGITAIVLMPADLLAQDVTGQTVTTSETEPRLAPEPIQPAMSSDNDLTAPDALGPEFNPTAGASTHAGRSVSLDPGVLPNEHQYPVPHHNERSADSSGYYPEAFPHQLPTAAYDMQSRHDPAIRTGATSSGGTIDGLPRRVRQASLAPQLQNGGGWQPMPVNWAGDPHDDLLIDQSVDPFAPASQRPVPDDRDVASAEARPEQVRSLMAALQTGWAQGRESWDSGQDPHSAPPSGRLPADHQQSAPERGIVR
jgi:signal transduction histidine kinase